MKEKERLVYFLTKKQLKHESGLLFIINEEEKNSYSIPRTVNYNGDQYLVTVVL